MFRAVRLGRQATAETRLCWESTSGGNLASAPGLQNKLLHHFLLSCSRLATANHVLPPDPILGILSRGASCRLAPHPFISSLPCSACRVRPPQSPPSLLCYLSLALSRFVPSCHFLSAADCKSCNNRCSRHGFFFFFYTNSFIPKPLK